MAPIGEHRDPRWSAPPPAPPEPPPAAAPSRAPLWREMAAVACLAVFPPLAFSLASSAPVSPRLDRETMAWHLLWSVFATVPLLWIARSGGMTWRELGIVRPRAVDLLSLALLVILSIGVDGLAWIVFMGGTGDDPESPPARAEALAPAALMVAAQLANGFAEEVAMRGYFIPRLRAATGSLGAAVAFSTIAFAAYHGYQGAYGVTSTALFGLVYALAFLAWRNVGVLALAHALTNLWIVYVARH